MPCLRTIVSQVDKKCNAECAIKSEKTLSKEQKLKATCKQVECNTLCYFENFSKYCPDAKDLLMRINLRQTQELTRATPSHQVETMEAECRNIHDLNYMKMRFVAI
uniref:CX9C domain-containing protein n=1 Tax=Steinernema glaseri TaxID=37863 RepID=A0A1I7ZCA3_9BILA